MLCSAWSLLVPAADLARPPVGLADPEEVLRPPRRLGPAHAAHRRSPVLLDCALEPLLEPLAVVRVAAVGGQARRLQRRRCRAPAFDCGEDALRCRRQLGAQGVEAAVHAGLDALGEQVQLLLEAEDAD
jgi:hypothetical protein